MIWSILTRFSRDMTHVRFGANKDTFPFDTSSSKVIDSRDCSIQSRYYNLKKIKVVELVDVDVDVM